MTETTPEEAVEKTEVADKPSTPLFPHDLPSEHWDVDFGDSKKMYEGTALPIWILAGWAAFILWALIYLFSGLPTAF
jgi:hypothetical protein